MFVFFKHTTVLIKLTSYFNLVYFKEIIIVFILLEGTMSITKKKTEHNVYLNRNAFVI